MGEALTVAVELWLATSNPAKAERLRWVFQGLGLRPRSMPSLDISAPDEIESTFRENAELKATFWSGRLGGLAAASDGGMAIPALAAEWDEIRTGRAAGHQASDLERAQHLLRLARGLVGDERTILWSEALALARDGRLLASWKAEGTRALLVERVDPDQIRPGFWAASLSYLPAMGATLAWLTEEQLALADVTWSRLRELVQGFFSSGQANRHGLL
jgi:inosine/xanthosine triphosphate pyrophosphatase family protein